MQVFNNATISSNGSSSVVKFGSSDIVMIVNITDMPTGTNPSLQFTIKEVDPSDAVTLVGSIGATAPLTSAATSTVRLTNCISDTMLVSWVLAGTSSPTFTGVNVTVIERYSGPSVAPISPQIKTLYDLSDPLVIYIGTAATGTPTNIAMWTIKKIILDANGSPTSTLWSSGTAVWDNRLSETYQ